MPPVRNVSAKPVKTERSHEENQERAYIAASRRNDRSLEARLESARRASEIHKKRTGRGLRVTEQDVINEEMYEEEDDDLPAQYRRFAAHLQNQSLWLDHKYESYMIANTAMRQAMLQQAMRSQQLQQQQQQQQQQNSATPFFAYNYTSSTASAPYQQQKQGPQSPTAFQQSFPYPIRQYPHQRSASIATSQQSGYPSNLPSMAPVAESTENRRRMSLPAQNFNSPPLMSPTADASSQMFNEPVPFNFQQSFYDPMNQTVNFGPLSPSLPLEQQQIVGNSLNPLHPSTQYLLSGSGAMAQQFSYNYDTMDADMSHTLDANALSITTSAEATSGMMSDLNNTSAPLVESSLGTSWDTSQSTWYDENQEDFKSFDTGFFSNSAPESGMQTPGELNFSDFIRDSGEPGSS